MYCYRYCPRFLINVKPWCSIIVIIIEHVIVRMRSIMPLLQMACVVLY